MVQLASQDLQNAIKFLEDDLLKKTNRTAQENQLLAEIQAKDYSSTGALGQFLQGVTRGGMDEITALGDRNPMLAEALRSVPEIQDYTSSANAEPITDYQIALALKRKNLKEYGSQTPISSTAAEGAGAITSLLPLFPFTKKKIGQILVNPNNFKQGVAAGGAEGAVSSFLKGEDSFGERMKNVPLDTAISATAGGVLSSVGNIVSPIIKKLTPQSADVLGSKTAKKIVNQALKNEDLSIGQALEMVIKKKDANFTIGDTADSLANLVQGINLLPQTSGKAEAIKFLKARQDGRLNRLIGIFDNVKGGDFINELNVLRYNKKDASKLYTKVLQKNKKMPLDYSLNIDGQQIKIMDLLNQSSMVDALESAAKIAKNIDPNFNIKFIRNDVGDITKIQTADKRGIFNDITSLDTKLLHYIKLGLDDATSKLGRDSSIGTVLRGQAYDTKNKFNAIFDSFNPGYKAAKNKYAEMASLTDAMFQGRNLKKALNNPQELEILEENLKYMGKSEKEAFFLGAMQFYKDTINTSVGANKPQLGARNIAEKLVENPTAVKLLKAVYPGDEQAFTKFLGKLKDEAIVQANTIKATGGSPTALRTELSAVIKENIPKQLLNARNINDVLRQTIGESADKFSDEVTDATSKQLFNILFANARTDPKKLKAIKDGLSGKITMQKIYEDYPDMLQAVFKAGLFSPQIIAAIQTNTGIGDASRAGARLLGQAVGGLASGVEF